MGSLPISQVNEVVIDPRDPKVVYAAGPSGVLRSEDSGLTWQDSGQGLGTEAIVALVLNPAQPNRMFTANNKGTLYGSSDGAKTWQVIAPAK